MFFSLRKEMRADPLNYEQSFSAEIQKYNDEIIKLANDQRRIIDNHLKSSFEIQQAFELLGKECSMMKDVEPFIKWMAAIYLWVMQDGMDS